MKREQQSEKSVRFSLEDLSLDVEHEHEEESDDEGVSTPLRSPPPATPTPSPTYSVSTLESSNGPFTPPDQPVLRLSHTKDFPYAGSPQHRSPAVPKLTPVLSSAFHLGWDMTEDPTDITKQLPLDGGNDQAGTMPSGEPIRRMQVLNDALPDWPLNITSSDNSMLTVHQVLLSIHLHLAKMVSGEYFQEMTSEGERKKVYERYKARTRQTPLETSKVGLQRIDYLPGRGYVGLKVRAGMSNPGEWEFILDTQ